MLLADKTKQRIEYIEHLLYWEGKLSRKDLTNFFNISVPQATKDIKVYIDNAPQNIKYDTKAKYYVATENFSPIFTKIESESYLQTLLNDQLQINENRFEKGILPSFYKLPALKRYVNKEILRTIVRNIRDRKAIEIEYQSMESPEPEHKSIAPHALGYDGNRWHVRAFCFKDNYFKDYNLSRISAIKNPVKSDVNPEYDFLWHTNIIFKIGPHPKLSESAKKFIELDYCMKNGYVNLEVKGAFIHYCMEDFKFAKDYKNRTPKSQQIVLLNEKEIFHKKDLLENMTKEKLKSFNNI